MQVTSSAGSLRSAAEGKHVHVTHASKLFQPIYRPRKAPAISILTARSKFDGQSSKRALVCKAIAEPGVDNTAVSSGPRLQPSDRVLKLWRKANAVCFDVDCEYCYSQTSAPAAQREQGTQRQLVALDIRCTTCFSMFGLQEGGSSRPFDHRLHTLLCSQLP